MAVYIQVVYALLFERLLFKTVPGVLSVLGTCIILGSAIYVAVSLGSTPVHYFAPFMLMHCPADNERTKRSDLE